MKPGKRILTIVTAALLSAGCSAAADRGGELLEYSNLTYEAGFDTVYAYTEYGYDHTAMRQRYEAGAEMFRDYNALFDIYGSYEGINNLKTINDNAGIAPVHVSSEIIDMLKEARYFYEISDGEFDITIGALLQLWHRYREAGMAADAAAVPSEEELQAAFACRGWDRIEINEEEGTVFITDPCVSLDVGGIAKGFAAERIARTIENDEVVCANINAGRNIRTLHQKADGSPWRIAIQNPHGEGAIIVIAMDDSGSVVTSGDYERYYIGEDGVRYHHIIDPTFMKPADFYHSVSVITADSSAADCLSTALFTMSIEDGRKVLDTYRRDSGNRCEAVWMMDPDRTQGQSGREVDGLHIVWTEGLEDSILWP